MAVAKGKGDTDRQKVTFALPTLRFIDVLATKGTHGDTVNDVIRSLVEEGIRKAIADHILSPNDGQVTPPPAASSPSTGG